MKSPTTSFVLLPRHREKLAQLSRELQLSQSNVLRLLIDQAQVNQQPVVVDLIVEKGDATHEN